MSGRLIVVGLGPGDPRYLTPEAEDALAAAEAIYGYGPYLDRVPVRAGQNRHASNNREERTRAATASIAVMPGMIAMSSVRQLSGPASISSQIAAAMAKTPGSPPDTTATRAPCAA